MSKGAVLVTGASSGIGLEIAVFLARQGYRVYATMRNLDRRGELDAAAARHKVQLDVLQLDITDEASVREAVRTIASRSGELYGLVNNAGAILRGYFEDVSDQELRSVFEANVFGTMALTRAVLPMMRAAHRGRVIIMSSTGGRLGSPGNSAYCASKFALEGFAECLQQEMVLFGVQVSLVEPGIVSTELFGRNRHIANGAMAADSAYRDWFQRLEQLTDDEVKSAVVTPTDVAEVVFEILEAKRPRLRYLVGRRGRFLINLRRYLPGEIFDHFWIREMTRRVTGTKA
jgi:NAD(P)-dependent dehydrogenase (short-subunit alcohol dehydrogenase family)